MNHELASILFADALITYATDPSRNYTVAIDNVDVGPIETTPIIEAHIIPADTFSDTLSGDHLGIEGMWQMKVKVPYAQGSFQAMVIGNQLAKIYKINKEFEFDDTFDIDEVDTTGFKVQVISPLKSHKGRNDHSQWEVIYYFEYRSDQYVEI